MRHHARRWAAPALLVLALGQAWAAPPAAAEQRGTGGSETRETMDRIFASIRLVLPLSLSDGRFEDPESRAQILAALEALAADAEQLERHGRSLDAGFGFLSGSLARDAREIHSRFADGRSAEARFLLHELTEDCVACHSRLPSDRGFPLGESFMSEEGIASLPLEERATLEVATRQFDRALSTLETLFASPAASPASLDLHGHLDDYLEICIRVMGDLERPVAVLTRFAERDDLTESLRSNLVAWIQSLRHLAADPPGPPLLANAKQLVEAGEARAHFPNARRALVEYVMASSLLHQFVTAAEAPSPSVGEAYYWLGVIESRIGRSFWLSQTESFLEASIRVGPDEPYAEQAFTLLEEFVVSGYTGSSGVHVPEDVRARLAELRALIDRS